MNDDLQNKITDRILRHLQMDGAWIDVTDKHDKTAKKDLLIEIENLVRRGLQDYEKLRV